MTSRNNFSRRQVLRGLAGCGAAAAVPLIVPSRVLGKDAPSGKVHVAMIGCGRQAYST